MEVTSTLSFTGVLPGGIEDGRRWRYVRGSEVIGAAHVVSVAPSGSAVGAVRVEVSIEAVGLREMHEVTSLWLRHMADAAAPTPDSFRSVTDVNVTTPGGPDVFDSTHRTNLR